MSVDIQGMLADAGISTSKSPRQTATQVCATCGHCRLVKRWGARLWSRTSDWRCMNPRGPYAYDVIPDEGLWCDHWGPKPERDAALTA
jgi:hypothetical protein